MQGGPSTYVGLSLIDLEGGKRPQVRLTNGGRRKLDDLGAEDAHQLLQSVGLPALPTDAGVRHRGGQRLRDDVDS